MTERDLSEMSDADLRRHLKHYRRIQTFWDDNDRKTVQAIVGKLEAEIAKRGAGSKS